MFSYGRFVKDKVVLGKKEIKRLIRKYPDLKTDLLKLFDKGGLVVVLEGNYIITLYKPKKGICHG